MVKYSPSPNGVPKGKARKNSLRQRALFNHIFLVESSYRQYNIFYEDLWVFFCLILRDRKILEKLIFSIFLHRRAIFHSRLPRGYISQYTPVGEYRLFCVLGNTLVGEDNIERVISMYFEKIFTAVKFPLISRILSWEVIIYSKIIY